MEVFRIHDIISEEVREECSKEELTLLNSFLEELEKEKTGFKFRIISDLKPELGLEIFNKSGKAAEIYCAEDADGVLTGLLQVNSLQNWLETRILSVKDTRDILVKLCV